MVAAREESESGSETACRTRRSSRRPRAVDGRPRTPSVYRKCNHRIHEALSSRVGLGGYFVRKGMGVAMAQWVVHRDTRWYDTPEEFRPERWEGDFAKRIPRFAY